MQYNNGNNEQGQPRRAEFGEGSNAGNANQLINLLGEGAAGGPEMAPILERIEENLRFHSEHYDQEYPELGQEVEGSKKKGRPGHSSQQFGSGVNAPGPVPPIPPEVHRDLLRARITEQLNRSSRGQERDSRDNGNISPPTVSARGVYQASPSATFHRLAEGAGGQDGARVDRSQRLRLPQQQLPPHGHPQIPTPQLHTPRQPEYVEPRPFLQFHPLGPPRPSQNYFENMGMAAARGGYKAFRADFGEDDEEVVARGNHTTPPQPIAPLSERKWKTSNTAVPTFDVDAEALVDRRPFRDFCAPGQPEYELFGQNLRNDLRRNLSRLNSTDITNPQEMCSTLVNINSFQLLPVDLLNSKFDLIRPIAERLAAHNLNSSQKTTTSSDNYGGAASLEMQGLSAPPPTPRPPSPIAGPSRPTPSRNAGARTEAQQEGGGVGAYGVRSLARLGIHEEGLDTSPMGYMTFMGMNIHKLVKNIAMPGPIIKTFAGPFAEHGNTGDCNSVEVVHSFEEYDLSINNRMDDDWRKALMLTGIKCSMFSMDTLLFAFYALPGTTAQILAGRELFHRGWRYHKIFQIWIIPYPDTDGRTADYTDPTQFRSGAHIYFNHEKWGYFRADLEILPGVICEHPD